MLLSDDGLTFIFDVGSSYDVVISVALNVVLLCVCGNMELTLLCDRFVSAGIKVRSDVFASFPCITPVLLRIVTTVCVMIGAATFYVIVRYIHPRSELPMFPINLPSLRLLRVLVLCNCKVL